MRTLLISLATGLFAVTAAQAQQISVPVNDLIVQVAKQILAQL